MRERPILFQGPLVRAILAGTKTQTRRLVKAHSNDGRHPLGAEWRFVSGRETATGQADYERGEWSWQHRDDITRVLVGRCPYGAPGDRLVVRENWTSGYAKSCWGTIFQADGAFVQGKRQHPKGIHYNAADRPPGMKWRPSIHLPHWASRITLEVTEVRVQRLQDISEEDAQAEGVEPPSYHETWLCIPKGTSGPYEVFVEPGAEERAQLEHVKHQPARPMWSAKADFHLLWNKINGERASWATNPFVWCVSFRRLP